jgi:hypothetical protein
MCYYATDFFLGGGNFCEQTAAPKLLALVQRPILRGFGKKPLTVFEHPERFLLTPTPATPATSRAASARQTVQGGGGGLGGKESLSRTILQNGTVPFSVHDGAIPFSGSGNTPSGAGDGAEAPAVNVLEGGTREKEFVGPSVQAFHADMMALYFHRKGKDHEALKWYVVFFSPHECTETQTI